MINRLDIKNFGCFSNFRWITALREGNTIHDCKRLNILYGRNYSGKTTLSRIFRSFEVGCLPENFRTPDFTVTNGQDTLTQNDVHSHTLDIRVYNKDFVDENLSFLNDNADGEVKTFAIIGRQNKSIENQIDEKELALGNVESRTGLRYVLSEKNKDHTAKHEKAIKAEQALDERLRRYANDVIKPDPAFWNPSYNIAAIKRDIETVQRKSLAILDDADILHNQDILKERALPDIDERITFQPTLSSILDNAKSTLAREITPSAPIQDLLNNAILQSWVRKGMSLHREIRSGCGFCGQALPAGLWEKLDSHFNKESSELEQDLADQIAASKGENQTASSIRLPEQESFYISERALFDLQRQDLQESLKAYQSEVKKVTKQLQARQDSIFATRKIPDVYDQSADLQKKILRLNQLIEKNNATTETLPKKQREARDLLRHNSVATFIRDIDLDGEKKKLSDLKYVATKSKEEMEKLSRSIAVLEREIQGLRTTLQDEKAGADKVNEYLNHFFGHERLRLKAVEDRVESQFKFQILRGSEPAYNMSEGECSLIAFCYFIARLEDIETKGKDVIIYIDDPVSSLDSNHIFFVYSLIESIIAKPTKNEDGSNSYQYAQLFISTHNLDFFKYLIRLPRPSKAGGTQFFLVEKEGGESKIRLMPKYLRDYQTEFHYLFHQIYRCRDAQGAHENHEVFYNVGNNLRKFLEAFLFYRYPYKDDQDSSTVRLMKFFGNDATATALTNRVSNELSHLKEIFDRSMRPIEIPEIPSVANFVLDKMYEKDKDQFNALLQSIGEPARDD